MHSKETSVYVGLCVCGGQFILPMFIHSVCNLTAFWPEKVQSALLDAGVKTNRFFSPVNI